MVEVSQHMFAQRQQVVSNLRTERDLVYKQLRLVEDQLAVLKDRQAKAAEGQKEKSVKATEHTPSNRMSPYQAVSRYAQQRGVLAARAFRNGIGDIGHIRDLADAALFGSVEAAMALVKLTETARTSDSEKQAAEAFAWASLALSMRPDEAIKRKHHELSSQVSDSQRIRAVDLLRTMNERKAILLTNPFAFGDGE